MKTKLILFLPSPLILWMAYRSGEVLGPEARILYPLFEDELTNNNTNQPKRPKATMPSDFYPFREWEKLAMQATRLCRSLRYNIPRQCCVGSGSYGAGPIYKPHVCNFSKAVWTKAQEHTWQYMNDHGLLHEEIRTGCDSCHIVDQIIDHNLRLLFVGDSLSHQSFSAFECDLHRQHGLYEINTTLDIKNRTGNWKYSIAEEIAIEIKRKRDNRITSIRFYRFFQPRMPNCPEPMKKILANGDVIVFDHGLHWKPSLQHYFERSMENLLKEYYAGSKSLKLLAWRETTSQHFFLPGGHFEPRVLSENRYSECFPIDSANISDHRPAAMKRAAEKAGFSWVNAEDIAKDWDPSRYLTNQSQPELVFLPFREYTVPLHYLHGDECTHYCHTPTFWQPVWRGLRFALDRALLRLA